MKELAASMLRAAIQLALDILGKDNTTSILQAEYDAWDKIADEAQREAFGK